MRVVERGRGLQFTPETLLKRGVLGEMGSKHLQRDDAIVFCEPLDRTQDSVAA